MEGWCLEKGSGGVGVFWSGGEVNCGKGVGVWVWFFVEEVLFVVCVRMV